MMFVKLTYFSLLGNQSDTGKYSEYCCVFTFCWLFTPLSFYINVFQFIVCSFCVNVFHYCKQSWLMVNKVVGLRSYQRVSNSGIRVSTNHFLFSGANSRSLRMTCFMKKMRYMEKNMRNGHAWIGNEVNILKKKKSLNATQFASDWKY